MEKAREELLNQIQTTLGVDEDASVEMLASFERYLIAKEYEKKNFGHHYSI